MIMVFGMTEMGTPFVCHDDDDPTTPHLFACMEDVETSWPMDRCSRGYKDVFAFDFTAMELHDVW